RHSSQARFSFRADDRRLISGWCVPPAAESTWSLAATMFPDPPCDHTNDKYSNQQDRATATNPLHQKGQTLSEKITEHCYHYRPENRAGDVVDHKNTPRHFRGSGEQGRKHAEPCDKARN